MNVNEPNVAQRLIREIESNQFIERRKAEYKSYKVCEGGQKEYVVERLIKLFPESYANMRISDISISNKVISKLSKAYKEKPIRMFGNQTEELDELFKASNFDSVMSEFDRDFNRQRYGLLWVNQIDGETSFHSLKGFESFVKRNQSTGELECVVLNYPDTDITTTTGTTVVSSDYTEQELAESQDDSSAEKKIYIMWSKDYHAIWTARGDGENKYIEKKEIEGNSNGINPLGVLPFIYRSKNSSYDLPFVNQLTDQSILYNVLNSDRLTATALQGYGQMVVKLPEDMSIETMHSGMTTALHLPIIQGADAQADASYINPNPDLKGMQDTINDYGREILDEHGIQVQTAGNNQFSSGLERLIANADVSDKISENRVVYAQMEQEAVKILQAYGVLAETQDELKTIFQKSKVLISDGEILENIKKRMDMGLITRGEALQIIDPNLSDDDAQAKLDKISEERQNNINTFMGSVNGQESDEENEA